LSHPPSLAATLLYRSILHQFRGDVAETEEFAKASIALSSEYGFPLFLMNAGVLKGWALAQRGLKDGVEEIRQNLAALRAVGTELGRPYLISLLAESLAAGGDIVGALGAIDEAIAAATTSGDLLNFAELYRLKGEFLIALEGIGKSSAVDERIRLHGGLQAILVQAEANFNKALEISRDQKAKSLELKATTSLANLWRRQGTLQEAREMLAQEYGWFTEGFDTVSLVQAASLLDELSHDL
jgi:predicted ATPase